MTISGYSERGIINSIAYFLDANPHYAYDFILLLGIPLEKDEYNYTFLIEQSFSDFGDSDFIIIIENKQRKLKKIVFIESKIKTCQGDFKITIEFNKLTNALKNGTKFSGISSNLFVQLYYKYLLIKTEGNSERDTNVNNIFKKNNNVRRSIGSHRIVNDVFYKYIKIDPNENFENNKDKYYFVAITSTAPADMDDNQFKKNIDDLKLMPSNNTFLVYWGNIKKYFETIKAVKVLDVFEYNEGQIY